MHACMHTSPLHYRHSQLNNDISITSFIYAISSGMHVTPQQRWDHLIRCRVAANQVAGLLGVQCGEGRWVGGRESPCPSGPISGTPFQACSCHRDRHQREITQTLIHTSQP